MDGNYIQNIEQEKQQIFIREIENVLGENSINGMPQSVLFEYDELPDLTRWWNG